MKRKILLFLSDTHANHKLGLLNPATTLFDEDENGEIVPYHPNLTASQKHMWKLYLEGLRTAVKYAGPDEILVFHNGDITQGTKYKSQLVSTESMDQVTIGAANMRPIMQIPNVKKLRLLFGTPSHVESVGGTEQIISKQLRAEYKKDVKAYYHGTIDVDGAQVDIAHHGPNQSIRIWLEGNLARYYLRDLMLKELRAGGTPPDLVVRSHFHTKVNETFEMDWQGQIYESRLIVTPALCMLGDYGRKVTRSIGRVTNGMVMVEVLGGRIQKPIWLTKTIDIRTKETL